MLIYLLKATLVWALSLLLFETLLRRNSYHAANRFYLLMTLAAGFVIPLVEWPTQSAAPVAMPVQQTFERISMSTEPLATTGGSGGRLNNGAAYLLALYACGLGVALSRIGRDAMALRNLRHCGVTHTLAGGYTLHETGGQHGPFSFFRSIFLANRSAYTADELDMVIAHERQHGRLLHSVDMLGAQTLKAVLWFHPLIHLYENRLRLVHEYEADEAAAQEPAVYGRFLVEQALSSPALTLTHSFHSPIKTRILMLTQNKRGSGRALRYFLTLPLIAALVAVFSIPGYTDERKLVGNKLFYKGHEFEMTGAKVDTIITQNPETGKEEKMVVVAESSPLMIDGEKIYDGGQITPAIYAGRESNATSEYFHRVKNLLEKLPDGIYVIGMSSPVIDKKGTMAYHSKPTLWPCKSCDRKAGEPLASSQKEVATAMKEGIDRELDAAMAKGFRFKAAELNGQPVASFLSGDLDFFGMNVIVVQSGRATLRAR